MHDRMWDRPSLAPVWLMAAAYCWHCFCNRCQNCDHGNSRQTTSTIKLDQPVPIKSTRLNRFERRIATRHVDVPLGPANVGHQCRVNWQFHQVQRGYDVL